jgi:16S rRNA (guanine966-N2)-methyltransferase
VTLRIQSGESRGRKLKSPPKHVLVRPILARIRKSLFDIIRMRLRGARFLDLYAGTGTVGLEALSNGAASTVFVEAEKACCKVIRDNMARMGMEDRGEVLQGDVTRGLRWVGGSFDFIFMGPPYKTEDKTALALTVPTLARIEEASLLASGGWVIGQHHKKEPLAGLSPTWEMFRQNVYGDSILSFFRAKSEAL